MTAPPTAPADGRTRGSAPRRRQRGVAAGVVAGPAVLAAVTYLWRVATPALWVDEGATWRDASLSVGRLLAFLAERDAVLGAYYLAMNGWLRLGDGETWLRLPSVLAAVGTVAVCADLARRWWGPRSALAAGLLLAVSPLMSRYAQEARPYALALCCAALSAWLLVRGLDGGRVHADADRREGGGRRWWIAYAVTVALLGLLQLLSVLAVLGHLALVVTTGRARVRTWLVAAGAGLAPAAVLAVLAATQRDQVAWIPAPTWARLGQAYVDVVGGERGVGFAALVLGLALTAVGVGATARRGPAVALAAWYAVPPLALAVLGLLTPLFLARYLLPSGLALVLLAAATLRRAAWWRIAVVTAVAAALGWPQQVAMRAPDGHGVDARVVAGVLAERCRPGDAVVHTEATVTTVPYHLRDAPCRPRAVYDRVPPTARRLWALDPAWAEPRSYAAAGLRRVGAVDVAADVRLVLWERP